MNIAVMVNIGKKIKMARDKAGLTQKDLAEEINVHEVTVARWESGIRQPSFDILYRIASITKMSMASFFEESELIDSLGIAQSSDSIEKIIARKMRRIREKLSVSRKDLSEKLNCSDQSLYYYEKNERGIPARIVYSIAKITGKPISWFYEEQSNGTSSAIKGYPEIDPLPDAQTSAVCDIMSVSAKPNKNERGFDLLKEELAGVTAALQALTEQIRQQNQQQQEVSRRHEDLLNRILKGAEFDAFLEAGNITAEEAARRMKLT